MPLALVTAVVSLTISIYLFYRNRILQQKIADLKEEGVQQLQAEKVRKICREETSLLRILVAENPHAYCSRIKAAIKHLQEGSVGEDVSEIIDLLNESRKVGVCDEEAAFMLKDLIPYCDNDQLVKEIVKDIDQDNLPVVLAPHIQGSALNGNQTRYGRMSP